MAVTGESAAAVRLAADKAVAEPTYENMTDFILAYRTRRAVVDRMLQSSGARLRSGRAQDDRLYRQVKAVYHALGGTTKYATEPWMVAAIEAELDKERDW